MLDVIDQLPPPTADMPMPVLSGENELMAAMQGAAAPSSGAPGVPPFAEILEEPRSDEIDLTALLAQSSRASLAAMSAEVLPYTGGELDDAMPLYSGENGDDEIEGATVTGRRYIQPQVDVDGGGGGNGGGEAGPGDGGGAGTIPPPPPDCAQADFTPDSDVSLSEDDQNKIATIDQERDRLVERIGNLPANGEFRSSSGATITAAELYSLLVKADWVISNQPQNSGTADFGSGGCSNS